MGVVHRDIKLENILINNQGIVKIADFGVSRILAKGEKISAKERAGTPAYMAPEMVDGKKSKHGKPVDIWAAGIVLFVLAYGHLPFMGDKSRTKKETQ